MRNREQQTMSISRRKFLKAGILTVAAGIIPCRTMAAVDGLLSENRRICIRNLHTKEYADVVFWESGSYVPSGLEELNHMFRDHYNGSVKDMDRGLFDLLFAIQQKLNTSEPFHLISGYRSVTTNSLLRKQSKSVAKKSLHIYGKAADLRLPGHKLKDLRKAAYELKAGGVGYYPKSNFLHVDVGNVRFWRG